MQTKYEGDLEALLDWAQTVNWAERQFDTAPEPYRSWVMELMPKQYRNTLWHLFGMVNPRSELNTPEWVQGYPHIHTRTANLKPDVLTAITYLRVAEEGGEFAMGGLEEDGPYETIIPEPGLTVICDAETWHGVRPVRKGTRIALISTGLESKDDPYAGMEVRR